MHKTGWMFLMSSTEVTSSKRGAIYWFRFVGMSAVISFAMLYLSFEAEFTAIRAVYEAY